MSTMVWGAMDEMTVLSLESTGHVLGALTRIGSSQSDLEVSSIAGETFPARNGDGLEVEIPVELAAVVAASFEPRALLFPREYVLEDAKVILPSGTLSSVALSASLFTVTLASSLAKPVDYVAIVEGGDFESPYRVARTMEPTTTPYSTIPVVLPTSATSGMTYRALVAVAGHQLFFGSVAAA